MQNFPLLELFPFGSSFFGGCLFDDEMYLPEMIRGIVEVCGFELCALNWDRKATSEPPQSLSIIVISSGVSSNYSRRRKLAHM